MSEALKAQVARMMRWQSRALVSVAILLMLALALAAADLLRASPPLILLATLATLCALYAATVLGVITLWQIFQAGRLAFGVRSGLIYALLAVLLPFWPGLYVIPHMVRLDIRRLLGVQADDLGEGPA
jgi:hypothetical protein